MITLGPAHAAARTAAAQAAARSASLAAANAGAMEIRVYTSAPGEPGDVQVLWTPPQPAAVLADGIVTIMGPLTAQIAFTGLPTWARITVGGVIWADCTVTDLAGEGPLRIDFGAASQLYAGGYAILARADFSV